MRRALETAAQGQPVILDICIDYSRKSYYAEQQEKAQLAQLPGRDKLGIVKRAIVRKIMGVTDQARGLLVGLQVLSEQHLDIAKRLKLQMIIARVAHK